MSARVFDKSKPRPIWIGNDPKDRNRAYWFKMWRAQPAWADRTAIRAVYAEARQRRGVVDHIVPLVHPHVCGLHVAGNLEVVTYAQNAAKGNRWWPDSWADQAEFELEHEPHQARLL